MVHVGVFYWEEYSQPALDSQALLFTNTKTWMHIQYTNSCVQYDRQTIVLFSSTVLFCLFFLHLFLKYIFKIMLELAT